MPESTDAVEGQTIADSKKPRRKRVAADVRREMILEAARITFSRIGDIGATTTKMIAEEAGISEAIIYRHFESKDELFEEAVLEPLRKTTAGFARVVGALPGALSEADRTALVEEMFGILIAKLRDVTPLLGLVLFGDPEMARDFYVRSWRPFLRELGKDWTEFYERAGVTHHPDSNTAARVVAGAALLAALDQRFDPKAASRTNVPREFTEMAFDGVFVRTE
jgi:AcrR family transcriptional regulator